MTSFVFDVLKSLQERGYDLTSVTYILPSKRAALFLKQELAKVLNQTFFSPEIITTETFVEELSQLKKETNTELIFLLYSAYKSIYKGEIVEAFDSFAKWGQLLLQDFNEIDRYLVPHEKLFGYLNAIKELNHWSTEVEKTEMVSNYLEFWNSLPQLYVSFQELLLSKGIGYQGLIYREALENLETYIQNTPRMNHVFIGFNALNKAEETIIQELLKNNLAEAFWNIDQLFLENPIHEAGLFLRKYKAQWSYYKNAPFERIENQYGEKKDIWTYGIPKNTGQAKHIGSILKELQKSNPDLENTALVLADESLLIPVLNSIPQSIGNINITMGLPLSKIPLVSLFDLLFAMHKRPNNRFYHKDVTSILTNPYVRQLYQGKDDQASKILELIEANNFIYLNPSQLETFSSEENIPITRLLFSNWENNPSQAIDKCLDLIMKIKGRLDLDKKNKLLQLEYLARFNAVFNELKTLNKKHLYINDLKTLQTFFKELVSNETLDFQGEPLKGLQIMGMLESRVLDFETVIIASINEGILPAGKSNNSFIPYDVKLQYGLPTFKEKDAVYAYHFYHLLQRAKRVYLLYNTEVDALNGGEKSRFLSQLEIEGIHSIHEAFVVPEVPILPQELKTVRKTEAVMEKLKTLAEKGFSPSSLTTYIRNPMDFYYQKVLDIKEYEEVEETIADNTLGTIVHNTLEEFFKPLVGKHLSKVDIESLIPKIPETVSSHFGAIYKSGDISTGKNLIIFEVAKRYVYNLLKQELNTLKQGHIIEILGVETNLEMILELEDLEFPIKLKGKLDRLDRYDGIIRIIDYKTGKVLPNQIQVVDWEDINTDYKKYSKPFQILAYTLMLKEHGEIDFPIEAGIISFKNLSNGFMKFTKKEKQGAWGKKEDLISQGILDDFKIQLKNLLKEIFNKDIDFQEKLV